MRKVRLGEAARVLTILTPHAGKVAAVAKGVCRSQSKMSGHLELFTHSQLELARGRNLDTVVNCQTINSFHHLKNNLLGMAYATYFCELADAFCERDLECHSLFLLLIQCLKQLEHNINDAELVRSYFEMHCLIESGYCPQSRLCVNCSQKIKEETNYFCLKSGGIMCPACAQFESFSFAVSVPAIKILRLLSEEKLDVCLRLKVKNEQFAELNQILGRFISFILERQLRTPSWIAKTKAVCASSSAAFLYSDNNYQI